MSKNNDHWELLTPTSILECTFRIMCADWIMGYHWEIVYRNGRNERNHFSSLFHKAGSLSLRLKGKHFLGNCPPTPPLSQHQLTSHLGKKCWLRGGVGGQFPKNVKWCNIKWADLRQSLKETSPNQHLILALYIFFTWFHHSCLIPPFFQSHVEPKLLCLKENRKENLWNYHLAKCSSNDQCVLVPAHVICLLLCLPSNLVPQDQLLVLFWSYEKFSKFLPSPTPSPLKVPNPKSFSGLAC